MCGIFGYTGEPNPEQLQRMGRSLSHRGPNAVHFWNDADASLGASRLSIVDTLLGKQPVSSSGGLVQAVMNGEIYNSRKLRQELEVKGHTFESSHSDTELIPHLYEERGKDFIRDLEGMFALAVWDRRRNELLLARDAVGMKPLYYSVHHGRIFFASEIKALFTCAEIPKEPDFISLHHYFSLKHVPSPSTAFLGISQLSPGEIAIFREGKLELRRWWKLDFREEPNVDENKLASRLRERLEASIAAHLQSDVEVGAFLSGGLDSSTVVAMMSREQKKPIKTFTLTYEDSLPGKSADREFARLVSKTFHTDHHELVLSAKNIPEEIHQIVDAFDEPFSGSLSTYFLAKAAAKEVKVILTGDGADELFGSYRAHREAAPRKDEVSWRMSLYLRTEAEKRQLYTPRMLEIVDKSSTENLIESVLSECSTTDPLNRMLHLDFRTLLPDQVLAFSDRLAMKHSLETRPPFLALSVVECAAAIPGALKIKDGRVKHILKEAVRDLLPQPLIDRPKEGFILPLNHWLSSSLKDFAHSIVAPNRLKKSGLIQKSQEQSAEKIWNLVLFQLWWEKYFG